MKIILCSDGKYRYIYKITISSTQQYYYGQHTSILSNDCYMGSGIELKKIYDLSGYTIANKEICCYAESEDQLNQLEAEYIGTKYKDDPLCLNKVPGGYYKRDDNIKHEVAKLGGKALAYKLKSDKEFKEKYLLKLKQSMDDFRKDIDRKNDAYQRAAKKNSLRRKNKKYEGFCQPKGKSFIYGKIKIYNDVLKQGKFININDPLPAGWRYGSKRIKNKITQKDFEKPVQIIDRKNKKKYLNINDLSIAYFYPTDNISSEYVLIPPNMKGWIYIKNKITGQRRRVPENIQLPPNWEWSKWAGINKY